MRLPALILLFFFFIALTFSQSGKKYQNTYLQDYLIADKLFLSAEKLQFQKKFSEEKEEAINRQALDIFQKIIPAIEKANKDSLAFFCHYKIGLLWHYFDSVELAVEEYQKAVQLKYKTPAIADSFLFQPLLFTGSIYYRLNKFDTAYIFFKKAEAICEKYKKSLDGQQRLYNWLGGMYYATGNYKQAKNYFEKAVMLLSPSDPFYKEFLINYKTNIASSLAQIERFAEADSIYKSILPFNATANEILLNIGIVNLRLGNAGKALIYFRKIQYTNNLKIPLYNQVGKAYWVLGKPDSTEKYFALALEENEKWNGARKNIQHGITFQYLAEKYAVENKHKGAIENYQKAIIQFYPDFNKYDVYQNPENFSGVFSYINLFNTLTAKADAFEKLYQQDKQQQSLDAALNAYHSAFKLADYVERTYESDEARLFLNKIKYNVHDKPIRISLQLYGITKNKMYLEEAYNFDQQNKASILSLNVQEQALKSQQGFNSNLFEEEAKVKTAITRLSLKAAQVADSSQLQKINASIRDNEIQLGKLQEKMNELPGYRAQKFAQSIPTVAQVQKILDKKTALLSYHLAKNELVILCITANEFSYHKQVVDSTFFNSIELLKGSLNNFSPEKQYNGAAISAQLYNTAIKPIEDKIKNAENLLIIPDDELNNLPFEALQDAEGKYLLEKFTVRYQYSTALLRDDIKKRGANKGSLAMAPFSNTGNGLFARLAYSKNEVENVEGNILLDNAATKKRFLAAADKYGILHLATHTIVNDTLPEQSLIAFYPATGVPQNENNLYVQEIYNLKLDSTKLVILSACETGTGKLAKGEGLMSLARAFTYAGCPNIIASLWKADDKSTAWIIQRFYHYQQNGMDAATALQKAKIDYIQSPDIEKRFKTPNYWAHLVLTGIPEKKSNSFIWLWITGIIALLVIALYFFTKKRKTGYI
jgi:CHAT domain-containing protein/tetratricopeptide (TPR) repeat protein